MLIILFISLKKNTACCCCCYCIVQQVPKIKLTSGQIFVTYKYMFQFNTLIFTLVVLWPQIIAHQALESQLLSYLFRITVGEVAMLVTSSNTHSKQSQDGLV